MIGLKSVLPLEDVNGSEDEGIQILSRRGIAPDPRVRARGRKRTKRRIVLEHHDD
jgi:hypothetical protein